MSLPDPSTLTFEQALTELQATVATLETGSSDLETNLAQYERGMALVQRLNDLLDQADLRVAELLPSGAEVEFSGPFDSRS